MSTILAWTDDAGAVTLAEFDIDENETHDLTNVITEHPVEVGSDIADNVRPQLRRFSVQGFVSDSPLLSNPGVVAIASYVDVELQIPDYPQIISESALIGAAIGAVGSALFGAPKKPKARLLTLSDSKSRKREMFRILEDAQVNAREISVLTSMTTYENMCIEEIVVTREPNSGNGASFNVSLKEIVFVTSEVTDAPEPAELTGSSKTSSGSQNVSDAAAKKDANNKTVAKKSYDALKKALGFTPTVTGL